MTPMATIAVGIERRYRARFKKSRELYEQALAIFPAGVTHDLRYMKPFPVYVAEASGSKKWSVEGHELIDWWSGHGALLLGHSPPAVVEAVRQQMGRATHPGACHELEIAWGRLVKQLIPSTEKVRFVSSGTEATMMALRLARTYTGKRKLLKFRGHFHGWNDFVIQDAERPYGQPVPGLGIDSEKSLVVVPPNDTEQLAEVLEQDGQIACAILEPTGGHYGRVPIRGPFLHSLRELTQRHGVLLIFDEVITGFRVHPGGAQGYYGIEPDLTVLAKILAGGLPGGCVAGRADLLDLIAFDQPADRKMPHPGTFNANPLSASAGIATLELVRTGEPCERANEMGKLLRAGLNEVFEKEKVPWIAYGEFSSIFVLTDYDGPRPDSDDFLPYAGAFERLDRRPHPTLKYAFRMAMLLNGVDVQGLRAIANAAHSPDDVDKTVEAAREAIKMLRADGLIGS